MIALLLAAQVAAAASPPAVIDLTRLPPGRSSFLIRRASAKFCAGERRYQTSMAEPALLLRPEDQRAREGIKKLADMPWGEFCLTGATEASGTGGK